MSTIVIFETDEAADDAARALGVDPGTLDACGALTITVNKTHYQIQVNDYGFWELSSNLDLCNGIRGLVKAFPDVQFVQMLRQSQQLLKNPDTYTPRPAASWK
jgi:hypothetical protein